ncbi:AB hydrolase-1 domain-containing protein [Favolaschia claudopus]|uniref:AB hydrolase-1 domain-containing protein n=1 Tax=Favolaschia claudopus TaxID=2862362 RepID=A0AAW0D1Q7_9AGAR
MSLGISSITVDCPYNVKDAPGQTLKMSATRYLTAESARNSQGLVLLFAHCIGANKEQWEPTIQRIFTLRPSVLHEAWAFDFQTHGESAALNRKLLETSASRQYGVSIFEWSDAITAFLDSPQMLGKRIVAVGHSVGAGAMTLAARGRALSSLPYESLILVEPMMTPRDLFYQEIDDRAATMEFVVQATTARRERWRSRDEAFSWMSRRVPWNAWDSRVVRKLVEDGLEDTPNGEVKIKGDRRQEALSYVDVEPQFAGPQEINRIAGTVPVHFIWGSESLMCPEYIISAVCNKQTAASVTTIDAGHMIIQEKPDLLADAICAILDRNAAPGRDGSHGPPQSKL